MASDLTVPALMGTGISLAIFVTFVYGAHMYLACIKGRKFAWEDGWLTAAYVVFIVITALYLNASDVIFRLEGLSTGQVLPYEPEKMAADGLKVQKTFFVTTSGLWICLWLIKASLLSLYKRLMSNLRLYIILWWTVVVICVVTLALAITSSMLSCSTMSAWFTAGACNTPRDTKAAYISLWYSYSADVFTDLLVMALPLGLIRNLQMQWKRKLSIAGLFCLGWICIAVSTIRATYLGQNATAGKFRQPSTSWLALWGIVESAIAVIIGCGPGLYRESKVISSSRRANYNNAYDYPSGGGYIKATGGSRSRSGMNEADDVELNNYSRATAQVKTNSDSQEELVYPERGSKIMVTRSVMVSGEDAMAAPHAK